MKYDSKKPDQTQKYICLIDIRSISKKLSNTFAVISSEQDASNVPVGSHLTQLTSPCKCRKEKSLACKTCPINIAFS